MKGFHLKERGDLFRLTLEGRANSVRKSYRKTDFS